MPIMQNNREVARGVPEALVADVRKSLSRLARKYDLGTFDIVGTPQVGPGRFVFRVQAVSANGVTVDQQRYDRKRVAYGLPKRNSLYVDRLLDPSTYTIHSLQRGGRVVLREVDGERFITLRWQAVRRHYQRSKGTTK